MRAAPAVFLDRDGTLLDDPGFLADPGGVRLLPGVAGALRRLRQAGFRLVVVTNQSGIGRGLLTEADVAAVHAEVDRQLGAAGAAVDRWLHCPHRPEDGCACRKPGVLLHRRAIAELGLDPDRSWCIGDRIGDVAAAAPLGAHAVLVETGEGSRHVTAARDAGVPVAADLAAAVDLLLQAAPDDATP